MSPPSLEQAQSLPAQSVAPPTLLLIAIATVGPVALNICMPAMPGMQAAFGTSYAMVQLTLTFYLTAMALSQIVFGPLSDRFGRRPVLIWGLGLFIAGSTLAALAPGIELLIAARFVQGLGGAAGMAISRAILRDCYSRQRSASMLGYVTMGMVVGPMVAPYLGGLLDETFGWHATFVAVVAVAMPILLAVIVLLRETNHAAAPGPVFAPMLRGAGELVGNATFWSFALALGFASAAFFACIAVAPYLAVNVMKLPPSEYGKLFALGALGYMAGNFLTGRFSERVGPNRMIAIGNAVGIVATTAMVGLALTGTLHPLALFVPLAFTTLSNGLVLPNAIANAISIRPDLAGAAAGLSGAVQLGIGALATVVSGWFVHSDLLVLSLLMAGSIAIATALSLTGRRLMLADAARQSS